MAEHEKKKALYRKAGRLLLPHTEADPAKQYTFPDPTCEGLAEAEWSARHFPETLTRSQLLTLCSAASAYRSLCTYELGQECCVGKLRDIWRALRSREATSD